MRSRRQVIPAPQSDKLMNTSACGHVMHHTASLQSTFADRVAGSAKGLFCIACCQTDHLRGGPVIDIRWLVAELAKDRLTAGRQLVNHSVRAASKIALQQVVSDESPVNL